MTMLMSLLVLCFSPVTADAVPGALFSTLPIPGTLSDSVNVSTFGQNISIDGAINDLQLSSTTDNVKVNEGRLERQFFSTVSLSDVKPTSLPVRRDIYIRGHLLRQSARSSEGASLNPIQRTFIRDFRTVPEPDMDYQDDVITDNSSLSGGYWNSTTRRKTKDYLSSMKKYFKFKSLQDSAETDGADHERSRDSQYYTLLYIVGILIISSLVTLSVCLVFGLCRAHIKRRLELRRRFDKSGEYERVDSVSSIVDSTCSQLDVYHDDPIEDVTII